MVGRLAALTILCMIGISHQVDPSSNLDKQKKVAQDEEIQIPVAGNAKVVVPVKSASPKERQSEEKVPYSKIL